MDSAQEIVRVQLYNMSVGEMLTYRDAKDMVCLCVTRFAKGWTVIENLLGHGTCHMDASTAIDHVVSIVVGV